MPTAVPGATGTGTPGAATAAGTPGAATAAAAALLLLTVWLRVLDLRVPARLLPACLFPCSICLLPALRLALSRGSTGDVAPRRYREEQTSKQETVCPAKHDMHPQAKAWMGQPQSE